MCGRFTSSQRRETVGERFDVAVPESYQERYNIAPQQRALIIREREDGREALMAKWGLLPHWAKDAKVAFKMINARAETLSERPAYRSLLSNRRCLIPRGRFLRVDARHRRQEAADPLSPARPRALRPFHSDHYLGRLTRAGHVPLR
jgi:putative SOS response-associated peptidase YedK